MRIYLRGGRGWGVSVGVIGGLILLVIVATITFWAAAIVAATLIIWLFARAFIAAWRRR
jgi:hypothetical protein